jgi:hypothetical protein
MGLVAERGRENESEGSDSVIEFKEFPKIHRLNRQVIVTEKIDGTNACVVVDEDGTVAAQSRSRIITPTDDNFGFANWVDLHREELRELGTGHHFGEWWGAGIQRRYNQTEKHFSLFNVARWAEARPACCRVVPVIASGVPEDGFDVVDLAMTILRNSGSIAAPGFMKPEGIVAYHTQGNVMFKVTLEKDAEPKGRPQP